MVLHEESVGLAQNTYGTGTTNNNFPQTQALHDTLSTQGISQLIQTGDTDKIIDFFEHASINQYTEVIEALPIELQEKVLPKLSPKVLAYLLNNFHGKLPGWYQSSFYAEHPTQLDQIKEFAIAKHPEKYSDKYKSIDFATFYADVQQVAAQNHIDPKDIFPTINEMQNPHNPVRVSTNVLIPIYIALRKIGYNHKELTE